MPKYILISIYPISVNAIVPPNRTLYGTFSNYRIDILRVTAATKNSFKQIISASEGYEVVTIISSRAKPQPIRKSITSAGDRTSHKVHAKVSRKEQLLTF